MKKINLKIEEILTLYVEITGINFLTNEKLDINLLTESISLSTKYKLFKLTSFIEKEISDFIKHRDILIQQYGESQDDKSYIIPNDKIDIFNKEIQTLLSLEIEVPYLDLSFNEFENVFTNKVHSVFYKILS